MIFLDSGAEPAEKGWLAVDSFPLFSPLCRLLFRFCPQGLNTARMALIRGVVSRTEAQDRQSGRQRERQRGGEEEFQSPMGNKHHVRIDAVVVSIGGSFSGESEEIAMPQIFRRSSNTLARAILVGGVISFFSFWGVVYAVYWSSYTTDTHIPRGQVVPFSHEHH